MSAETLSKFSNLDIIDSYAASARAIRLWLNEFADENLNYPDMIAECARRANKYIEKLREELATSEEKVRQLSQLIKSDKEG